MIPFPYSILESEGWFAFNREKWGFQAERLQIGGELCNARFGLETIFYRNRRGRYQMPRLNPYLPLRFTSPCESTTADREEQWRRASAGLVEECARRQSDGMLSFAPDMLDASPWLDRSFHLHVRYTHIVDLPLNTQLVERTNRSQVNRAKETSYHCGAARHLEDVVGCLNDTEKRQGFQFLLTLDDLRLAAELLGGERFRPYVCYSEHGEPVSTVIILHSPGGIALGWVAGTRAEFLRDGVYSYLWWYIFEDLATRNSLAVDLMGANLPNVSAAKRNWGGRLLPYVAVEQPGLRSMVRHAREAWQFMRIKRGHS